jgi:integrase/recombinase XerD
MKTAPSFEELVSRYQQHQEMLNRSAHAWRSHRTYLRQYARFLIEHQIADVLAVTASQVRDFQRWLYYLPTQKGVARKVTTQNRTLETIRSFHRFLKEENLTVIDPAAGIERAKEPQPLPRNVLTPQEARKVVECPNTKTSKSFTRPASVKSS